MKRKFVFLSGLLMAAIMLVVGLSGCAGQPGVAAAGITTGANNQGGISVSGQGKVTVIPNIAALSIGINAQAATVAEAQAQAAAAMDRVISSLTQNGVDRKDIQTQNYSIQQTYIPMAIMTPSYPPVPETTITPTKIPYTTPARVMQYQVSNTVTVKIRNVDKAGVIIDAAATAGGDLTRINGVSFSIDQPDQYYAQARELAVKNAADKAAQLAKLAGVTMGKAISISEDTSSPNYPVYYGLADNKSYASTPFVAGQTDIIITVQITYAIQ